MSAWAGLPQASTESSLKSSTVAVGRKTSAVRGGRDKMEINKSTLATAEIPVMGFQSLRI